MVRGTQMNELYARYGTKPERPGGNRIASFFKDFDHYIDFAIARFLVWRKLRHERKEAKGNDKEG